ncbi:MAG: hypothetical protein IPL38_11350 [Rhodobacter sp.]|nr:hypothetical protein [Rhodobacter sp.]
MARTQGHALIKWLTGAENLHCGLWDEQELSAGNLRRARDAYSDKLFALFPPGLLRVLDIGGARRDGEKADRWAIRSISSCPRLSCGALPGDTRPKPGVHECGFSISLAGAVRPCLFSELPVCPAGAGVAAVCLCWPGGSVLIADCFRAEAYQGRQVSGPQPGGVHRLTTFRAALSGLR